MSGSFRTISPVDGSVVFERALDGRDEIEQTLAAANKAFGSWQQLDLDERCTMVRRFVELAVHDADALAAPADSA